MTEFESKCYGMSQDAIRDDYMNGLTARIGGLEMVVASILSDCQELIAMSDNNSETVRKQLNVAKFILTEMVIAKQKEMA